MTGMFDLRTAADLREKLRRDLEKLKGDPQSPDLAFNFFVTAEHMLDWVYPKRINNQKRTDARNNSTLLQVCSHLANGAKHLEVEDKRHDSVKSAGKPGGYFGAAYFASNYFGAGYFGDRRLMVNLRGDAATELGPSIGVVELADRVMDFWDKHPLA